MTKFEVTRSATIAAEAARVHMVINDFQQWRKWSPWEDVDPDLERTYGGAPTGTGATYSWTGNRKAGQGAMEITSSTPEQIDLTLSFIKPFKANNDVSFTLTPTPEGTVVRWSVTGDPKGIAAVIAKLFSIDKLLGKDLEKGLLQMKAAAA